MIAYPLSSFFIRKSPRVNSGIICFFINGAIALVLILNPKPFDCNNKCFEAYLELAGIFLQRVSLSFYFSVFLVYAT